MSHPLAEHGRRPLALAAFVAFTAALLALLSIALPASAATPTIENGNSAFESLATAGETNYKSNKGRGTVVVRHDRGRRITRVQIDQDYNGAENWSSATALTVSPQTQTIAGGADLSRASFTWDVATANLGFQCSVLDLERDVSKAVRIRAVLDDGTTTAAVSRNLRFIADGDCWTKQDFATIHTQRQSPSASSSIAPGESVTFTFRGDDIDDDDTFSGVMWRARRISNGTSTADTYANLENGDNADRTLTVSFPDRGRWVVEAKALVDNSQTPQSDGAWFWLGAIDVNSPATTSPTVSLAPVTKRLTYGAAETSVTATAADAADSGQGGGVSSVEWDLDDDAENGVGGFETGLLGDAVTTGAGLGSNAITSAQRTRKIDLTQKGPGTYTVRARVSDSGAASAGDSARRTKTASATYTVDTPPVVTSPAVAATDWATPVEVPLAATDADDDALTWSVGAVSPAAAGSVTLSGGKAVFTPAAGRVGSASFTLNADDGYGGGAAPSASKTVTVQVVAPGPDTQITSAPEPIDASASATFAFAGGDAASYECRLDGAAWTECESPFTVGPLANGSHTFAVRGLDADGTPEFRHPSHTWSVLDVTAPTATITEEPETPTNDATPTFAFTADEEGATFACSIDGAAPVACASPYTLGALSDGAHTFSVVATDVGGNASLPVTRTFALDVTAPVTTIDDGPSGPTNDPTPTVAFSSDDADATFECHIGGEFDDCASPFTADELTDGEYTFAVRAIDSLGNIGAAVERTFTVDTAAPAAPAVDVETPTTDTTPEVTLTHAEGGDGVTFRASVDEGEWATVTSPFATSALTDGDHTVAARSVDAAGNEGAIQTVTVTVDTTAPVTEITDGPEGPTNDDTPTFAFGADDDAATFACWIDDGLATTCESPFTAAALEDGEHTFAVQATDALGNFEQTRVERTFTVDTVAPAAPTVTGPTAVTNDRTPQIAATIPDGSDGVSLRASIDGGDWTTVTSPFDTPELADGEHTVAVRSVDAAGNESEAATITVTIDATGPVVTITGGPGGATASTDDATPTFTFTSEDGATFACRVDTGEWGKCASPYTAASLADGDHTFSVQASDGVTNMGAVVSRTFSVDTTGAVVTITGGPSGLTNDATPEFTFTSEERARFACRIDTGEWGKCTSPFTAATLTDGEHTFSVQAADALGNLGVAATRTFTVDATAPEAPVFTAGPDGPTDDATPTFAFTAEDRARFACRIDAAEWGKCASPTTLATLADGEHTFSVKVSDSAKNESAVSTRTFTVDTTGAVATITGGPSGLTNDATPEFTFTSEDRARFACRIDAGEWGKCASPFTATTLADGEHTFSVKAADALGNEGAVATRTFTVDATAPAAPTITDGPDGPTVDSTPTFAFTAEDRARFACRIDTGEWGKCASPFTAKTLADGEHTFSVKVSDSAKNESPVAERTFSVDTTAPATTITEGPEGLTGDATPTLTFSADDAAAKFEVSVDSGAWVVATSPLTLAALTDGEHTVAIRATDALDHVETTPATLTFTVDTTAPGAPALEGPAGDTVDTTPTYTFAHAAGAGDGATFACRVDGGEFAACTSPTTLTELTDGQHTFSVRSVDAAGNTSAAATRTVDVDTTAPGTVIDGGPTGTIAEATARFTFASADPDVARFECRVDGGAFAACTSPYTTGTLTNGDHLFEVRGTDALGNVESPPAQRKFTVAVPAPPVTQNPTPNPTPTQNPPVASGQQPSQTQTERSRSLATVLLTKVALSQGTLTAKKPKAALRFTLAEQARVVVRVEQPIARGGKTKYRVVRRIVRTAVAAGDRSLTITRTAAKKALPAGTYRVSIVATAINKRTQTARATLTVR